MGCFSTKENHEEKYVEDLAHTPIASTASSKVNSAESDDFASRCRVLGADLPPGLRTENERWLSLFGTFLACCVTAGPIMSFMTIEPVLIEMNVFNGKSQALNDVFNAGMAISMASTLPVGILYDVVGPNTTAVTGGLVTIFGILCMALSISDPSLNWILYGAYPVTGIGSNMCAFAIFPFAWALPDHQNAINSVVMGAAGVSGMATLVMASVYPVGISLHASLLALAVLCLFATGVFRALVPTKAVTDTLAAACVFAEEVKQGKEAAKEVDEEGERAEVDGVMAVLGLTWESVKLHWGANVILLIWCVAFYLLCMYVMVTQLFYFKEILDSSTATSLVEISALLGGGLMLVCGCIVGAIADEVGLERLLDLVTVCTVLLVGIILVPSFWAQVVGLSILNGAVSAFGVIITRVAMLYVPPQCFATFCGGYQSLCGISQMLLVPLIDRTASESLSGPSKFTVPYIVFSVVSVSLGGVLRVFWLYYPPPAIGMIES